jgi:hypothetical protein
MKFSIATLLVLPALAAAFVPAHPRAFITSLEISKAEDLELTRKVIYNFIDGPAEESAPAPAPAPAPEEPEAAVSEE